MANDAAFLFNIKWIGNIWDFLYHLSKTPNLHQLHTELQHTLQVACFEMKHKYSSAGSYKNA